MPPAPPTTRLAATISSLSLLSIALALLLDLNGNILLPTPLPDILNPAPKLLCLTSLIAACLLALLRTIRYPKHQILWFALTVLLFLLLLAFLVPIL